MFQPIADAIAREFSGHRARNHAIEIHRTDRFSSFDLYQQTAGYCARQMQEIGLQQVERLPCKADGRTAYGDWFVPLAWDAREAILTIPGTDEVLARYPDIPCALFMYSAPTPEAGIESEIVEVEDLNRIPDDFRGRLLFYSGPVGKAERQLLARRGIVGIVRERSKPGFPEWRGWDNYTFAPRNEEGLFGFSLSSRAASRLRAHCRHGAARLFARVQTRLYEGAVDNVTAILPGAQPDEEVLLLAHLYEQGANDNASGAGAGLETFRTLKTLIDRGTLPRPRRTLRILLGFECCGFMGYVVSNKERMERTVAAINPDMVGEDQEACGSSFALHLAPGAAPSCVDALAIRLFEELAARRDPLFRWRTAPYTVCDSFVADPTIGVPSVSIIGLPDRFYHSSMDTPEKVSADSLDRTGLILATYLAFLADAGAREAQWLADAAGLHGRAEIARAHADALLRSPADPMAAERLAFLAERHGKAVESAIRFGGSEALGATVAGWQEDLRREAQAAIRRLPPAEPAPPPGETERRASARVPTRLVTGPLTLEPLMQRFEGPYRWSPGWAAPYNDYLIWADGKRSVLEIWRCARREAPEETRERGPALEEILDYFEFLSVHGYVRMPS